MSQENDTSALTDHQKDVLRQALKSTFGNLLGIPYDTEPGPPVVWTGRGKWLDLSKPPKALDCSGGTAGTYRFNGFKLPDGALNQYNFTIATDKPKIGDLAFFAKGKDITKVDHVGMVYSDDSIIEARAHQENSSFETGKVIIRPRKNWENYKDFVGYRAHPKLI